MHRLIYRLYQSSLPWTAGGEYLAFYRLVKRLLAAWKTVGLDPLFVFDGMPISPSPIIALNSQEHPRPRRTIRSSLE